MALSLRIERRRPPLPRFFSSSPDDNDKDKDPQPSSISSHFRDVKATLKHQHSEDHLLRRPTPRPSFLSRPQRQHPTPSRPESLEEIRKQLSEFRRTVPPPPSPPSFQKVYQHNDLANNDNTGSPRNAAKISLDRIRESLRGITDRGNASASGRDGPGFSGGDRMSLSRFTETLRLKPEEADKAASRKSAGEGGKGDVLPWSIFGKEIKEKNEAKAGKQNEILEKTKFLRSYEYEELGEKLRMLRNADDEGMKGFSLEELNERLVRLKEMEAKEMESRSKNNYLSGLRDTLLSIKISEDEKEKKNTRKWAY